MFSLPVQFKSMMLCLIADEEYVVDYSRSYYIIQNNILVKRIRQTLFTISRVSQLVADNTSIIVIPEISTNSSQVLLKQISTAPNKDDDLKMSTIYIHTFCYIGNLPHELCQMYMFEKLLYLSEISRARTLIKIRATYFRKVSCYNVILGGSKPTNYEIRL